MAIVASPLALLVVLVVPARALAMPSKKVSAIVATLADLLTETPHPRLLPSAQHVVLVCAMLSREVSAPVERVADSVTAMLSLVLLLVSLALAMPFKEMNAIAVPPADSRTVPAPPLLHPGARVLALPSKEMNANVVTLAVFLTLPRAKPLTKLISVVKGFVSDCFLI